MDIDRWDRIRTLFAAAIELPPGERSAYLDRECGPDPSIRRDVEDLLSSDADASRRGFLEATIALPGTGWDAAGADSDPRIGHRVGPYVVREVIGAGGMGRVYRAERVEGFEQAVAVKFLSEWKTAATFVERFRNEVEIQAALGGHPNIAGLLDASETDDGRPYIVMEYVDGRRIDDHCEARRHDIDARVRLFLVACEAVSFAHRHAVLHRDLKPSNILVTTEGAPKLIDFGIAKLIDPPPGPASGATPTATAARLLTPEYASPEHIRGEPLTTASDVYSLGVVLYELLTGRRPHRLSGRSPLGPGRFASDGEPDRPSLALTREDDGQDTDAIAAARSGPLPRIKRRLKGDLDTIVLMALRREPARRYQTVDQLADDLRRHLDGRPVLARPDSWVYRARKFVGRNRLLVATAALLVLALVGGIAGTSTGMLLANRQRERAEQNLSDARANLGLARRAVDEAFTRISDEQLLEAPHLQPLRRDLLAASLPFYRDLVQRSGDEPSARADLAASLYRLADINEVMGRPEEALAFARRGLEIYERLASEEPALPGLRRMQARCEQRIANLLGRLGQGRDSFEALLRARALLAPIAADSHELDPVRRDLAEVNYRIGLVREMQGDFPGAMADYGRALALIRPVADGPSASARSLNQLSTVLQGMAVPLRRLGRRDEALARCEEALRAAEAATSLEPLVTQYRRTLAGALNLLGIIHGDWRTDDDSERADHKAAATAHFRRALEVNEVVAAAFPSFADYQMSLSRSCQGLALHLKRLGDLDGARPLYERACEIRERLVDAYGQDIRFRHGLANTLGNYCALLLALPDDQADLPRALDLAERAVAQSRFALERMPRAVDFRFTLAMQLVNRAMASRRLGETELAFQSVRESFEVGRGLAEPLYQTALECSRQAAFADREGRPEDRAIRISLALQALQAALDAGFDDLRELRRSPDLDPLRPEAGFGEILGRLEGAAAQG